MEVTDDNFKEILPEIKEGIENCTFASVDCEFTGLHVTRNINAFDTPREYYEKCRRNCREFLVIQYGLSLFRYDPESDSFKQRSYNFYIFRKPNRNIPDLRFLSQSSSIDFLVNQGFDFNKLFKQGISYLNQDEANKYRSNLNKLKESSETDRSFEIVIPDHAKQYVDDAMKKVSEFVNSDLTELELPKCNSYFRRLMYQLQQQNYIDTFSLETRLVNNDSILFLKRPKTKEERDEFEKQKFQEKLDVFDNAIGFSKILQMLSQSRKLVVGHNLCFDLLHTIDKFFTPLPEGYEHFKKTTKDLFPKILDTKYMSSIHPFDTLITSSILKPLLATVCKEPFSPPKVEIENGFKGYQQSDAKDHEAGYDAYMAGLAFLCMWKYLGTSSNISSSEIFNKWDLLDPYINRIGLTALMDKQYINLDGEDLKLQKDHVFYMTFPNTWNSQNILQLFSPFSNVNIYWINDTSAYVSLYKKEQAPLALKALANGSSYTIMSYHNRQAMFSGIKVPLSSPITRKRKSGDDLPPAKRISRSSKTSIDSIEEQVEAEENGNSSTKTNKMFVEDTSWD